jgi:hypothetical protein
VEHAFEEVPGPTQGCRASVDMMMVMMMMTMMTLVMNYEFLRPAVKC